MPDDLSALRSIAGDSALTYTLVLGAFHYVNRMADLLHVDSEILPGTLRRFASLRRIGVFVSSKIFSRMDLHNRRYGVSFDASCDEMAPVFEKANGRPLAHDLEPLRTRPALVEVLRHSLEERDQRSLLSRDEVARVHALVEEALPRRIEETEGFHARPEGAVEAFVFVGTRYPARTTAPMIDGLRAAGYDDLRILDLAHAVADANQWARVHRLLGLRREILVPYEGPAAEVRGGV